MKYLLFAVLLAASPAIAQYVPWTEGAVIGVKRSSPQDGPTVLYINTTPGNGYSVPYSNNFWGWIDITPNHVPDGTKAVFVGGIMSILGGYALDACNLTVALAAGDTTADHPYIFQAVLGPSRIQGYGIDLATGTREIVGAWVPLDDSGNLRFKVHWWTNSGDTSDFPANCAFFVNLQVEAYVR